MSAPQRPGEGSGPAGLLTLSGTHSGQGTFWGSSLVLQPPASPCAAPQGQGPPPASVVTNPASLDLGVWGRDRSWPHGGGTGKTQTDTGVPRGPRLTCDRTHRGTRACARHGERLTYPL